MRDSVWVKMEQHQVESLAAAVKAAPEGPHKRIMKAFLRDVDAWFTDMEEDAEDLIGKAREAYALGSDNDVEIDDAATLSRSDNGTWVSAWVYVYDEDAYEKEVPVPGARTFADYDDLILLASEE